MCVVVHARTCTRAATRSRVDTRQTDTKPGAAAQLAYGDKVRAYWGIQHALVGELAGAVRGGDREAAPCQVASQPE